MLLVLYGLCLAFPLYLHSQIVITAHEIFYEFAYVEDCNLIALNSKVKSRS